MPDISTTRHDQFALLRDTHLGIAEDQEVFNRGWAVGHDIHPGDTPLLDLLLVAIQIEKAQRPERVDGSDASFVAGAVLGLIDSINHVGEVS